MSTESAGAPVALVTGADKGIGLETARRLAEAGYRAYLTARNNERGQAAAVTVGARFLALDVTSGESVRHAPAASSEPRGTWTCWSTTLASPARCVVTRTTTQPTT